MRCGEPASPRRTLNSGHLPLGVASCGERLQGAALARLAHLQQPVRHLGLSLGTAYLASHFNNIMDFLQLVFGFVNAPLFATFLLGMFWKRTTGHGAFFGLLGGTLGAAIFHGLAIAEGILDALLAHRPGGDSHT